MIYYRKASKQDIHIYFKWVNDPLVRQQSFNSEVVDFSSHEIWFLNNIEDENNFMFIFHDEAEFKIGQVRIHIEKNNDAIIGISVDNIFRGMGYGVKMLNMATDYFFKIKPGYIVNAYIKEANVASKVLFEKANFIFYDKIKYKTHSSFHYIKKYENS